DESRAARYRLTDAYREIVDLTPRAGIHDIADLARQSSEQPFRQLERLLREIPGMSVQNPRLARQRIDDIGMAMPNNGHIVIRVEVSTPLRVIHPNTLRSDDMQRLVIEKGISRSECARTARAQTLCAHFDHNGRPVESS